MYITFYVGTLKNKDGILPALKAFVRLLEEGVQFVNLEDSASEFQIDRNFFLWNVDLSEI